MELLCGTCIGTRIPANPRLTRDMDAGLSVAGLRLTDGSLVLKLERGFAAVQFRVEAGGGFGSSDGVLAQHDLLAEPRAFATRLRAAHALALGEPPWQGGGRGTETC